MPEKIFIKEYKRLKEEGLGLYDIVGKLSEEFLVSAKAIEKRFVEVGIV